MKRHKRRMSGHFFLVCCGSDPDVVEVGRGGLDDDDDDKEASCKNFNCARKLPAKKSHPCQKSVQ